MTTKLTLTIDDKVIRAAKQYAQDHQTSVSEMVENYLEKLTNNTQEPQLDGIVAELAGVLKELDDASLDSYSNYLSKKYKR